MPGLKLITAAERPQLAAEMLRLGASPWPQFLDHDAVVTALWRFLYELAPDYQFALLDERAGSLAAMGNCIPIRWDGNPRTLPDGGIDAVLEDGVACLREGATPTAASALMVVVSPERLGKGISGEAIRAMAEVVGHHGLADLVAPVRPTEKHRYPLIPIERYIRSRRDDGLPFDAWIRLHERVGGEIVRPASAAMRVTGTVAEWERWTGLALPESGSYVVPGALVPVAIDRDGTSATTANRRAGCTIEFRFPEAGCDCESRSVRRARAGREVYERRSRGRGGSRGVGADRAARAEGRYAGEAVLTPYKLPVG